MPSNSTQTISRTRRLMPRWVLAAALTLAGGGIAVAQTPAPTAAQCENLTALPANTQMRVTQQLGRAMVEIDRPDSAGRKVEIEYGDELYSFKFGNDGRVRASFALIAPNNRISIAMSEAALIGCTITVPDFAKLYRVVLRWRDPVQLELNVIEPGGRIGESGHVNAIRPNADLTQGIGRMDIAGAIPPDGVTAEMSYVVANSGAIPPNSTFSFKLDYVSRGVQPEAPYCEDHPLAAPQFEFIAIENGTVNIRKMSANRAKCSEKIADARRLMPIRQ